MHFPLPNSPYISVIACVSRPPPRSSSRAFEQVVSFATDFRRSKITSPVSKPPMSTASRAAMMIFWATFVPISAASATIVGEATASPMSSVHKVVSTTMALQERVEARKEPHGPAICRCLFQVSEVLPQQESAPAALVHLDELPAEPVQDDPKSSNVHAGPSPEIGDIGRAEGAQMMPDQRVLGLFFRGHRGRLPKPIIHAGERDLWSLARTEAHEAPNHGRPDKLPRGVGPLRLVSPPSVHPVFRLRPKPLRQIRHELGPR